MWKYIALAAFFFSPFDSVLAGPPLGLCHDPVKKQNVMIASIGVSDVPLLPSCPSCPPIPLPPTVEDEPESGLPMNMPDNSRVVEGSGRYDGMLLIPSGDFEMGSRDGQGRVDERPLHKVFLKDFYIAKHAVTVKQFCDFLNAEGPVSRDDIQRVKLDSPDCPLEKAGKIFKPKLGFADKPMVCVSWQGAIDYSLWAGGRLPSSAEWEKAALYTQRHIPSESLRISDQEASESVVSALPGIRGMRGMIGNVWEWCADWYARDYYAQSPQDSPQGPAAGIEKIVRGGSWASPETSRRIQNVHRAAPRGFYRTVGFRIVKD